MERTLIIIKPDAVERKAVGKIIDRFMKMFRFTEEQARQFYIVHKDRPFYEELVKFMTSGPVVAAVLEGEDVIERVREIIGPTDSEEARRIAPNSIRALFGTDKGRNAIHASDSIFSHLEIH